MQHYGIPTRLLDWSESLAVALHFTVRPIALDLVAPTIWVLDPFGFHELENPGYGAVPIATVDIVKANADLAFGDGIKANPSKLPIPVAPDFIFDRLANQNGAFTIHGTDVRPIEQMIPVDKRNVLLKFVAREDCVSKIYDVIDLVKPSADLIFPDVEGMIDYIV